MAKRSRWNRIFWGPVFAILLAAALYVVGSAWILSASTYYSFTDLLMPRLVDLIVVAWLFWVGSAIGSFLNVVAYRLPLGRDVGGFSACPYCNTPLAKRDIVPVFGWLSLRGRCRACRLPIAARYPIVEASVGVTLTLVGIMGLYLAGINLPYWPHGGFPFGAIHMPSVITPAFAIGVYHMLAVTCSWALGLIRVDGVRLPRTLLWVCFSMVVIPMLVWPPLQVVSWQVTVEPGWVASDFLSAVLRILTGVVAALVLGRAIGQSLFPGADIKLDPLGKGTARLLDLMAILAIPGIVVGWQALIGVCLLACLLAIYLRRYLPTRDGLARLSIAMPVAFSLQLAAWRWLDRFAYWPGTQSPPWVILAAIFILLVITLWLKNKPAPPEPVGVVV